MKIEDTSKCYSCGSSIKRQGSSLHAWDIEYECGARIFGAIDTNHHGEEVAIDPKCPKNDKEDSVEIKRGNKKIKFKKISEEDLKKERNEKYNYFDIDEVGISDDEIEAQSWKYNPVNKFDSAFIREAFIRGCEWYREELKNRRNNIG